MIWQKYVARSCKLQIFLSYLSESITLFLVSRKDVNGDGTVDVADIGTIIDEMAANARREGGLSEVVED